MAEFGFNITRKDNIGYIGIPNNVIREEYITYCLNKERVCIWTNNGEFIQDVPVSTLCLDKLDFPEDNKNFGSCVIFINESEHNKPIIIGVLSKQNESNFYSESQIKIERKKKGYGVASFMMNPIKYFITFILSGKTPKYLIKVLGEDVENTSIQFLTNGFVLVQSQNKILLQNKKKQLLISEGSLTYKDEFGCSFVIDKDGYTFNDVNLGTFLTNLLDTLMNSFQVNSSYGPTGFCKGTPTGELKIQDLINSLENLIKK